MGKYKDYTSFLDEKHRSFKLFQDPFVQHIWSTKYRAESKAETSVFDTFYRVAEAVGINETQDFRNLAYAAMCNGCFMPAGRILSSAGLDTNSTLQNCYVSRQIPDTIEGIHQAYAEAMTTLGRYGGIGMDFSPIRPRGAKVGSQGLTSPGVVHWMRMWHDGAERVKQAGHRRGAMMGTIADHHPDIWDFIKAKHTTGALTNFNVSVLISDKFMDAVKNNYNWQLWHERPRDETSEKIKVAGKDVYLWEDVNARDLWDALLKSTYEFSEPGVIFIDRINQENNLWYCEDIRCTNPCGEQPLPPYGACNLGHINLARMVADPFLHTAHVNYGLLEKTVKIAVRFLDCVIDVSNFPLHQQKQEQINKRRVGLGVSGLADMLIQLGQKYSGENARCTVDEVMEKIAQIAYETSHVLAVEKGHFPLWDQRNYGARGFAKKMAETLGHKMSLPIRNSLLLTVAPTGTVSIVFGNISSGIEPNFAFKTERKVWTSNTTHDIHINESFISRFAAHCGIDMADNLPYFQTVKDLTVDDHVKMQSVVQKWIDASVTKTVNCPSDITFEDFEKVYEQAYESGCKGCTTYRPSEVRGSVLEDASEPKQAETQPEPILDMNSAHEFLDMDFSKTEERVLAHMLHDKLGVKHKRPDVLMGCTYKIKWPHHQDNIYLTINEHEGVPYEVFIATMDLKNIEWMVLGALQLSRSLRRGEDPIEEARLFQKIQGSHEGAWIGEKYYTSLPAYIGKVLETHFEKYTENKLELLGSATGRMTSYIPNATDYARHKMSGRADLSPPQAIERAEAVVAEHGRVIVAEKCPSCSAPAMLYQEGCKTCTSCGYNKCG